MNNKLINCIQFFLEHKLIRICRKAKALDLIQWYYEYAPLYWADHATIKEQLTGALVIQCVGTELKHRFPSKDRLQAWDLTTKVDILDLIGIEGFSELDE